jgi:hypothetical protein
MSPYSSDLRLEPNLAPRARLLAAALMLAVSGGCTLDAQSMSDEEVETEDTALTNSGSSADPAYIVNVNGCTGSVISQHYILSAAHCFRASGAFFVTIRTGMSSENVVYSAQADVVIHPNWVNQAADREAWDLAVVRLRNNGMGSSFPRVRIYAGPETPWTSRGGMFHVSGYGDGSAPGGARNCTDGVGGGIKRGGNFAFLGEGMHQGTTWFSVRGYSSLRSTCAGDSGSPYLLNRNGEDFLFAVHSRSERVAGGTIRATMVQAKLAWIQARTADTLRLPLACTHVRDHRVTPTIEYYNCVERPLPPVLTPGLVGVTGTSLTGSL